MQLRHWNIDTDYDTLVEWWDHYDFGRVPKEALPRTGMLVEDENKNRICAGGLYIDHKFAFMEWVIVDPKAKPKLAHSSIKLLIDSLVKLAKDKGCILLYTVTENPGLHKRYVKYHGFSQGENKTRSFMKDLTDGDLGPMLWAKSQEVLDEEQDN